MKNVAQSVHARLLNRARAEDRPFNELLQYFAMERFLFRLSRSDYADQFVLKGALMLQLWGGTHTRATKDIDLLGRENASVEQLVAIFRSCLAAEVEDDGLLFDKRKIVGDAIRLKAKDDGVRVRSVARLGDARVQVQVDVGFGDVVTPHEISIQYPTLLDFEAPQLLGYTPETVIAEKVQAMVELDMANSRLKDFLDIWTLSRSRKFEGTVLLAAIAATFGNRDVPLLSADLVPFGPAFHSSTAKRAQWAAYIRKNRVRGEVPSFSDVVSEIEVFLSPVLRAFVAGEPFEGKWAPGGPWLDSVP